MLGDNGPCHPESVLKALLGLFIGLQLDATPKAATLHDYRKTATLPIEAARETMRLDFRKADSLPTVRCGVSLYRIHYWSTSPDARRVLLSGLVVIPDLALPLGLVVYLHGTTAIRSNVPSNSGPGSKASFETWLATLAFGCGGYVMAAPDYFGLGDSPGHHLYLLGSMNTASGSDIIVAARELAEKLDKRDTGRLYITGYSEGGALAMWLIRKLQESRDPAFYVTAAAPISGPYDLSGAQTDMVLRKQSSIVNNAMRIFFMAYYVDSISQNFAIVKLSDYFVPSFASYIPIAFGRQGSDEQIGTRLGAKGVALGALFSVDRVLTARALKALREGDEKDPVMHHLYANNCYGWSPTSPIYLLGLKSDQIVTYQNTINTARTMRMRGISPRLLNTHAITKPGLNHLNVPAPLLALARKFFDRGFAGVPCDPMVFPGKS